jgi:hypothetical protein
LLVVGGKYFHTREQIMSSIQIGLTDFYNAIHSPEETGSSFQSFRELQIELDSLVARSYGWGDIDLGHGFHTVSYLAGGDEVRFTVSEDARLELLRRLLELNMQRHEEEVAQGLQGSAAQHKSPRVTRAKRTLSSSIIQPSLDFETDATTPDHALTPVAAILSFLDANDGWNAKTDVLAATGITERQWSAAITTLLSEGRIERQGEKRGTQYRTKNGSA